MGRHPAPAKTTNSNHPAPLVTGQGVALILRKTVSSASLECRVTSPTQPQAPRFYALIPCAGSGSRAAASASGEPKQYRKNAGRRLVEHALLAFSKVARIELCLVVTAKGDRVLADPQAWYRVADCGGPTRAATVRQGLARLRHLGLRPQDWVLVHDAARALVTADLIDRLIDSCCDDEVGGLLALPLADSLKLARVERVAGTIDRSDKWLAQTPQMFRAAMLEQALQRAGDEVSDESGAIEALGHSPRLVPGRLDNFKVTFAQDFDLAETLLKGRT